jgi:decaprenylphospho-beta-D-ribofuranose 2-oxidase
MKTTSWGNYPKHDSKKSFYSKNEPLANFEAEMLPYGNGRSYGDCCVSDNLIDLKNFNHFLDFDENEQTLTLQSGITLEEVIDLILPKGFFPLIVPGTKYVTIGGAIASDIHGKNHHIEGCFSNCVEWFNLLMPNGKVFKCSKTENDSLFKATCGGMGLTGIILEVKIKLKKVTSSQISQTIYKTKNLKETFEYFEKTKNTPYSVAWIDCLAKTKNIGRSIFMHGDFLNNQKFDSKKQPKIKIPFYFPNITLNNFTVKLFNFFYYNLNPNEKKDDIISYDKFFFPLDSILKWNNIYGSNGFTQYQFILPFPIENCYNGLKEILEEISKSGKGSFLAVLKLYGDKNSNYLSFPLKGYSLALDFKIDKGIFELLDRLDQIILKYNGRIYLSKDCRISKTVFEKGYPDIEKFKNLRAKYDLKKRINSLQSLRLDL